MQTILSGRKHNDAGFRSRTGIWDDITVTHCRCKGYGWRHCFIDKLSASSYLLLYLSDPDRPTPPGLLCHFNDQLRCQRSLIMPRALKRKVGRPPASRNTAKDAFSRVEDIVDVPGLLDFVKGSGASNREDSRPPKKRQRLNDHRLNELDVFRDDASARPDHVTLLKCTLPIVNPIPPPPFACRLLNP